MSSRIDNLIMLPIQYITAGNASFELISKKTGVRYKYNVKQVEPGGRKYFVSYLSKGYGKYGEYLGMLYTSKYDLYRSKKTENNKALDKPFAAFKWAIKVLSVKGEIPNGDFLPSDLCCVCNKPLKNNNEFNDGIHQNCLEYSK